MKVIFIALLIIVFYSYIGYALLLQLLVFIKRRSKKNGINKEYLPTISLIIPAYNEKECIDEKMQNTFQLNYPKEKLKIIWVTDGSDDGSAEYIQQNYVHNKHGWQISCYHQKERRGKTAAINRAMNLVDTEILVFCDANTLLNKDALVNIVQHFQDDKVGCVAGEKRVLRNNTTVGDGESLYWKYEAWIKKLSSDFYTCIGAVGELIAFRKSLFQPIPEDTILDDFVLSMQIADAGYRILYEPNAYAEEAPSLNEQEEMKRKVRIAAGAFQCIFRYPQWMNIFKHFILSFQYLSHKVSRWVFVPLSLPLIFLLNIKLFFQYPNDVFYSTLLFLQFIFYCLVLIQYISPLSSKLFRVPYYITMMNMAMYKGFWRYITRQQSAVWEKVQRKR